jgi:hypothetical protein
MEKDLEWGLLLTIPPVLVPRTVCFCTFCRQNEEPTSGLEPLSCSLRVNYSYWTILCFTLLDNGRYQRERRSVMRCNERLAVRAAPSPYRGLGIALRFTSKSCKRRADERTRTADLISLRVIGHVLQGCAGDCKYRISKPLSLLCHAQCCSYCVPGGIRVVSVVRRSSHLTDYSTVHSPPLTW